jgi:hypothetical protein
VTVKFSMGTNLLIDGKIIAGGNLSNLLHKQFSKPCS